MLAKQALSALDEKSKQVHRPTSLYVSRWPADENKERCAGSMRGESFEDNAF
ncbi:MAG: hypothetical protein GY820_40265 [Gammaproteobacteria bacterium]|nr:hypothetical protein [Gammaproteobacteria bacterium]